MAQALEMIMQQTLKRNKNLRLCIRCNHMEKVCSCKEPLWVSKETALGKSIVDLRRLPKFKSIFHSEDSSNG